MMAGEQKLRYLLIILILIHAVASFDPLSFLSASVAVVGTTLHAGWHMLHCRHSECCDNAWIPHNFTSKNNKVNVPGNRISSPYM